MIHSMDYDEWADADLRTLGAPGSRGGSAGWAEYVYGIAWALGVAEHAPRGWEGVIIGDVPLGAGLSSSAALELATARAFATASDISWDPIAMAKLAQRAENEWVGVNCGIMDQLVSAAGAAAHALLIDCRTLAIRHVPLPQTLAVVVLDTATRRGLVNSAYNERRQQCEAAAAYFGVPTLRDVDAEQLATPPDGLDAIAYLRARHVVTENARTLAAADALARCDAETVGALMNASHASLRDDFEVSRDELDVMVSIAQSHAACYGARMTGAGFGGCAVALVARADAEAFAHDVTQAYRVATSRTPAAYVCIASPGADVVRA